MPHILTFTLAAAILLCATVTLADDVGITTGRLIQESGKSYLLEAVIRTTKLGHLLTQGTADSNQLWLDLSVSSGGEVIARSGTSAELIQKSGIGADSVVEAVRSLVKRN